MLKKLFHCKRFRFFGFLIVALSLVSLQLPAAGFAAPSITVNPLIGPAGMDVTVVGHGFSAGQSGWVWFDTNADGLRDANEPSASVSTDGLGNFTITLATTDVPQGYYPVRADIPGDGSSDAQTLFGAQDPILILGISSGPAGTPVMIHGRNFAPSKTGWVWFDTNNDYHKDVNEPGMKMTADSAGGFSASVTIPNVSAGAYHIRADIPENGYVESDVVFTTVPSVSLNPAGGMPGTLVTISGGGFEANQSGIAWFDTNRDGVIGADETTVPVTSDAYGRALSTISIPRTGLLAAAYPIWVDLPTGSKIKTSANFAVKGPVLALSTRKGVPGGTFNAVGSNFPANTPGWVWFDSNNNSIRDSGEVYKKITSNDSGAFTVALTIPSVPGGTYAVRSDFPGGNSIDASTNIVILTPPSLTLSLASGSPGTIITINGKDFLTWTSGYVWFDTDGDGKRDPKEPSRGVTTDSFGRFRTNLSVPAKINRGVYAIYADIPAWGRPEGWTDFFVTSGKPNDELTGALHVVSTSPYDDAMNVKRYPTIKAFFNTRLVKGPDYEDITLADEDGNEVQAKVSIYGKTLKIQPSRILRANTTYMLTIPAQAVLDMRGSYLEDDFTLVFTTRIKS